MKQIVMLLSCITGFLVLGLAQSSAPEREVYLSWSADQAVKIGRAMRANGKVEGSGGLRITNTDQAVNYKLRATWLTPEVIRAAARLEQVRNRLTDEQTSALVAEADAAGDTVVMVEIDPNEGSGVIPLDWRVFLQPKGLKAGSRGAIAGIKSPQLRNVKALSGVMRRDYDYDVFWVVFPLVDENRNSLISENVSEVELMIGIYSKEGRVTWPMPESIRRKIRALSKK
jgi:hypothetical protein